MKDIKYRYLKYALFCTLPIFITALLTFPPIRNSIPLYAPKVIIEWVNMLIIPIILSLSTGGLVSVWFTYKSSSEQHTRVVYNELEILQQMVLSNESEFYAKIANQSYTLTNRIQQFSNSRINKPICYYAAFEYPEIENILRQYDNDITKRVIKPLYERYQNEKYPNVEFDDCLGIITRDTYAQLQKICEDYRCKYNLSKLK